MASLNANCSSEDSALAVKNPPEDDNNNNNNNNNISNSGASTSSNIRATKIKRLKAKLINEEHRLVMMKKIRQSQTRPVNPQQQQQQLQQQPYQAAHSQVNNIASNQLLNNNNSQQSNPTKKLRPSLSANNQSNSSSNLLLLKNQLSNENSLASSLPPGTSSLNQTPAHAHQRTKSNALWNQPPQMRQPAPVGIAPPHVGNMNRNPITTPPNVVQAMMGGLNANQQSLLINQINALTAAAANTGLGTPGGSTNRRSAAVNNLLRQPITTPPNVIQDVRGSGANLIPGAQSTTNRRAHSGNQSSRQQPLTTPTNVLPDIRGALSGQQQQSLLMNANNLLTPPNSAGGGRSRNQASSLSMTPQMQQSPFNKSQAAQLLVQRRSAAKQAVQKQLEQTLMQLPQKHIQLGIDFIPNANNVEFVCYIGLEACVDYLTQTKNPLDTQPLEKPFVCSTCGTDFTPSWSWKRSNPVCENCVSNHVKKSMKNSQSNRIKSVLSKAAKQEQEIDQKIMAEAASVVTSPSTPTASSGGGGAGTGTGGGGGGPVLGTSNQRHSSLLQPVSHPSTSRSSSSQQQHTPNWPRVSQSPSTAANRSTGPLAATNTTPSASGLPNMNMSNQLALLSNLSPAALTSLLQMHPQFSTLANLMAANAAAAAAPPLPPPPPPPVNSGNNSANIAQVAALLMNQFTANFFGASGRHH